jgi:hypothetical protein
MRINPTQQLARECGVDVIWQIDGSIHPFVLLLAWCDLPDVIC